MEVKVSKAVTVEIRLTSDELAEIVYDLTYLENDNRASSATSALLRELEG